MRIGFFDLETSSLDAEYGQLLCGVIGEYNSADPLQPKIHTYTLEKFQYERWDDTALAVELREALEQYDLLISYNGVKFDVPFLNTRLIEAKERCVNVKRHKDLLYTFRFKFRLGSNRLARVTQFLYGKTEKTVLDPQTWRQAICGKRAAYDYIIDHCKRDVTELAKVWDSVKNYAGMLK